MTWLLVLTCPLSVDFSVSFDLQRLQEAESRNEELSASVSQGTHFTACDPLSVFLLPALSTACDPLLFLLPFMQPPSPFYDNLRTCRQSTQPRRPTGRRWRDHSLRDSVRAPCGMVGGGAVLGHVPWCSSTLYLSPLPCPTLTTTHPSHPLPAPHHPSLTLTPHSPSPLTPSFSTLTSHSPSPSLTLTFTHPHPSLTLIPHPHSSRYCPGSRQ